MNNERVYAEKVINAEINFERIYLWSEEELREAILHKTEKKHEEEIDEIIKKIKNEEKVTFVTDSYSRTFYVASEDEIEQALASEKEYFDKIDKEYENYPNFVSVVDAFFED